MIPSKKSNIDKYSITWIIQMSNIRKMLDTINEMATVSGSVATVATPLGSTQRRNPSVYSEEKSQGCHICQCDPCKCDETNESDGTKAPDAPKAKEFGLWKNSILAGSEQKKKKAKSSVKEDKQITEWREESEWKKSDNKDPRGKVTHMSDVARRKTEKEPGITVTDKDGHKEFSGIDDFISKNLKDNTRKHPTGEQGVAEDKKDYTGQDLVKDANRLFTAGGFKLADKQVDKPWDDPKKINTIYFWRKKIPGLGVQELMIEVYNYAPHKTYYAVNDLSKDGARVTPDLAQKMWSEMEFQIKDMSSQLGLAEAAPKITGHADYTGQDLVKDATRLFTAGGFRLVDKQVEPRSDDPKKINTIYFWRKKIPGLGVQELMIEVYNYAPHRTYYAVNDYSKDGAKVTPELAQKMWSEMEFQIKDMSSQLGLAESSEPYEYRIGQQAEFVASGSKLPPFPVVITSIDGDYIEFRSASGKPIPGTNGETEWSADPGWKVLTPSRRYDPNSLVAATSRTESKDQNELDRPDVQDAIKRMAARHKDEKWSLEKSKELGKRLAAAGKKSKVDELNTGAGQRQLNLAEEERLEEHDIIISPNSIRKVARDVLPKVNPRKDHEVEMARSDLYQSAKNAKQIYDMIESISEDQGLEGWVQEKIIKAADYLNTVREYLEGEHIQHMRALDEESKTK